MFSVGDLGVSSSLLMASQFYYVFVYTLLSAGLCTGSYRFVPLSAIPDAPKNLTLSTISSRGATLQWSVTKSSEDLVLEFQMILNKIETETEFPQKETGENIEILDHSDGQLLRVDGEVRQIHLANLQPETEYQVYMFAVSIDGHSNISDTINFKTLPGKKSIVIFFLIFHLSSRGFC